MLVIHEWLKEYIGDSIPSAKEIEKLLTFHSFEIEGIEKVEGHEVIDVDILPNRSSDCLCHRGIAREIATLTGNMLEHDPLTTPPDLQKTDAITVNIEDAEACPRFTASLVTDIEVKDSPEWLQRRLKALGQRPINNIVDATNYVMYAIGQPIHAYDADLFPQIDGKWQFGVRLAKEGEVVSLITEGGKNEDRDVTLKGTELLIIDESSNTPIGLAGVKGGRFAGVHGGTTKIIIEAAHFNPNLTRKTARRLGIVIDASKRFENEPSRDLPPIAQSEILKLIIDIAGGHVQGTIDEYPVPRKVTEVFVRTKVVNALLGLDLAKADMISNCFLLGASVREENDENGFYAVGPMERTDLTIEEDFIEEIGRIHGYDHVESVVPGTVPLAEINTRHYYSDRIRKELLALGFSEVITSSFRKKDQIHLQNALASDKEYLRSSLIKNITETLDKNVIFTDLLGTTDTRVFEIGTVFSKTETGIREHVSLCIGVRVKPSGYVPKDDILLEEIMITLIEKLNFTMNSKVEKGIIELNLSEVIKTLPVPEGYEEIEKSVDVHYKPFSLFPSMSRDIAMWVSEGTTAEEVKNVLNKHAGDLRVRTTLFDQFTKEGKTSYAFRLVFQSKNKTLTDEEVNAIMDSVYSVVTRKGWKTR